MRNVAFSILLFALAVVQIAVVTAELPRSHVHATSAVKDKSNASYELAAIGTERKPSAF